ncbi:MAG: chemotaxis protein CheX [Desulfamplus sp.]|nr:chemotaxis protein CheX [Desulfamplus sp.]
MSVTMHEIIKIISQRAAKFLKDEMAIDTESHEVNLIPSNRFMLNYLTTVLTIGGDININVIFSFEHTLIRKIFEIYTEELDVLPEEEQEYIEETAGDMINIVVGNSTVEFRNREAVSLSPPIMISEAKSIAKSKHSDFFVNHLRSIHGTLSIFCIASKDTGM